MDAAAEKIYAGALASGEIERAGPFAWTNERGTKKLSSYLGLPDDHADRLITALADRRLKAAGFPSGTSGNDYIALRVAGADGSPGLYVQALNADSSGHTDVLISLADLKAAQRQEIEDTVGAAVRAQVVRDRQDATPMGRKLEGHPVDQAVTRALNPDFHDAPTDADEILALEKANVPITFRR